jgi:hypothetical protein
MSRSTLHMRLSDLPLWRLLVALDDAERTTGADSPTARALASAIRGRLRGRTRLLPADPSSPEKGGPDRVT